MTSATPVKQDKSEMFSLLNPQTMRVQLPALAVGGLSEPLRIHLDFNAAAVDDMLLHLTILRLQMLPAPQRN